jgi:hypothetical protein
VKKTLILSVFLAFCLSSGCKKVAVVRSFCYWETNSYFAQTEDSLSKKINFQHLCVRFFDVDLNPNNLGNQPVATLCNIDFELQICS